MPSECIRSSSEPPRDRFYGDLDIQTSARHEEDQASNLASLDKLTFFSATSARRRAEQDAILLANRIRLLRAEEEKTKNKIHETEKRTRDIIETRRRNDDRRLEREAQESRNEAFEQELRQRALRGRVDQQQKLLTQKQYILDQKVEASETVRKAREVGLQAIEQERRAHELQMAAKAERVRNMAGAAAQSRARSEGVKKEQARYFAQERVAREEEEQRHTIEATIRMEREEAELMKKLAQSREQHRAAFSALEDALRPAPQNSRASKSRPGTPGDSYAKLDLRQSSSLGVCPTGDVTDAGRLRTTKVSSKGGSALLSNAARPPRPRDLTNIFAGTAPGQVASPSRLLGATIAMNNKFSRQKPPTEADKGAALTESVMPRGGGKNFRSFSSCSTADPESCGGGGAGSGTATPSSLAPTMICYTTVDGEQLEIPSEDDLNLADLLSA